MDTGQLESALRELEVVDTRVRFVERAVMRGAPLVIEQELRDLARATSVLTDLVRRLYEHVHGQEKEEQEEVRVLDGEDSSVG